MGNITVFDDFTIPDFPHTVIDNAEDVTTQFINRIGNWPHLAYDFETTGTHYMHSEEVGVAIATGEHSWYLHGPAYQAVKPWLIDRFKSDTLWSGHNIGFELHFSKNSLGTIPRNYFDTMVAQWMLDENDSLGLKEIAQFKMGLDANLPSFKDLLMYAKYITSSKKVADVNIHDIPLEILGPYAAFDGRLTYDLKEMLVPELQQEGLYGYFNQVEMPFTNVIMEMEKNGIGIDLERTEALLKEYLEIKNRLEDEWLEKSGNVNPRSPDQLRDYLFGELKLKSQRKTQTGKLSTDFITLLRVKHQDKTGNVELLTELRQYEKLISTYLKNMLKKNINGRMHTDFNQTGTVTGRLSSSGDLNLQNIPVRSELGVALRYLFVPDPGYDMVVIDYSQIELRLIAHMSRDAGLVRAFVWNSDLHQLTADLIGSNRKVGKTVNYAVSYGASARVLCDNLEKDGLKRPKQSEAERWLETFDQNFPGIPRWKKDIIREARLKGFVTTIGGRHRHVSRDLLNHWDGYTRSRAERQAINSKPQGSAGDVINKAMIEVYEQVCKPYGARLLLQVHDELVLESPKEHTEQVQAKVQEIMENMREEFAISVPVVAEPCVSDSWGACK